MKEKKEDIYYVNMLKNGSQAEQSEAFKHLQKKYFASLLFFIAPYVNDFDLRKVIVGETFTKMMLIIDKYNSNETKFNTWLHNICKWILIDNYRRREKKRNQSDFTENTFFSIYNCDSGFDVPTQKTPHSILIEKQLKEAVHKAISKLNKPNYKEIIEYRYFQNKTHQEIADIMGMKIVTVRGLAIRAEKELKEILINNNVFKEYKKEE